MTLVRELIDRGVSKATSHALAAAIEPALHSQPIKEGTKFDVTFDKQIDFYGRQVTFPIALTFSNSLGETINVTSDENGQFAAQIDEKPNFSNKLNKEICTVALDFDRRNWSSANPTAVWVQEAKRRKLGIGICRIAVGLSMDYDSADIITKPTNFNQVVNSTGKGDSESASAIGMTVEIIRLPMPPPPSESVEQKVSEATAEVDIPGQPQLSEAQPAQPQAGTSSGKRIALVVGNQKYALLSSLSNPANDAALVTTMLESNGFAVTHLTDVDFVTFHDELATFQVAAAGADVALVYYSGHGLEINGKNVLAPVDMPERCSDDGPLLRQIALSEVIDAIEPARNRIVMLDACRSAPFPSCKTKGSGVGGFKGLQAVESGSGYMLVNSTRSGKLAADGAPGENSPFAKALVAKLSEKKDRPMRSVIFDVIQSVANETKGDQNPEVLFSGVPPSTCLSATECNE